MLLRFAAFATASLLFVAQTSQGLYAIGTEVAEDLTQVHRQIRGHFTDAPTRPYLGDRPSHAPRTRGGLWSEQNLQDIAAAGLYASEEEAAPSGGHTLSVNPGAGGSLPWEGGVPGMGGSGGVNTGNGNKLTSIPLFAYKVRGGMTLDFTLYHNSQTAYTDELGHGWTWTYDIYINDAGPTATVHWGNGLSVPYTLSSGTYTAPAGIFDSLVKNGNNTWTLTKKDGTVYSFNTSGFCYAISDRNSNTITLTLNSNNYCTGITDPSGRQIDITLDSNNNFTAVEDPNGNDWTFTINGSDDLTTITWPVLNSTTYTDGFSYSSHRITTHTDRRGKAWTTTYNTDGSTASETNPLSKTTTYSYASGATTITDPLSHTTVHNYSSGKLASVVDKASFSESYTSRNSNNQVTAKTDRRGKSWAYTYDSRGNVLTITDPLSHVTTYTWSTANDLLTITDALSHVTTHTYDSNGNRLTTTNALSDQIAEYTYDSYGQCISFENALTKVWTLGYDTDGNLDEVIDPLTHTTTVAYDGMSRMTGVTNALTYTRSIAYDVWGRPTTYTNPDSTTKTVGYNATGQITSRTDELSRSTTYGFDDAGQLTSLTNAKSETESYAYDDAGRRTTVTNGRNKTRTYTYTNRSEPATLTLADSSVEEWAYNGNGQRAAYENPLGQTIYYTFDDAGRQTGVDYPTGTDTIFGYDNANRTTSMVDSIGTNSWTYDNANQVTQLVTPQGTMSYTYDDAGRKLTMVDAAGTTTYGYDDANRLTSLVNAFSETTSWTYDNINRVTRQDFHNGTYATYTYNSRDFPTAVNHKKSDNSNIINESTTFNNVGNVTQKTVNGDTTSYTYDNIDQLLTETFSGATTTYTYDANGNRATKIVGGVTDTYNYDDADKLTSITQGLTTVKSYGYDAAGRTTSVTTSAGTTTLGYDYESRVTGITYPSTATNSFSYNGLHARVSKIDSTGSSTYKRSGVTATSPLLNDGTIEYTPGISTRSGTTTKYQHTDRLGSVLRQTNPNNSIGSTQRFDAFGNLAATSGTRVGPFGFAGAWGYQSDIDSGLQLLGRRYYDTSSGRFLTRDGFKSGRNWYSYCDSSPLTRVDPNGLFWIITFLKNGRNIIYHIADDVFGHAQDLRQGGHVIMHDGVNGTPAHLHNVTTPPPAHYTSDPISDIHVTTPEDADAATHPDWIDWRQYANWIPVIAFALSVLTLDPIGAGESLGDLIDGPVEDANAGLNGFARQRWLDGEDGALLS